MRYLYFRGGQTRPLQIREYIDSRGRSPFRGWLDSLQISARARIQARLLRLETSSLDDYKSVGSGVMELKLDFGPGYRIYFGIVEEAGVLPLVGGDKHCPRRDIKRAQDFWNEYLTGVSND